MVLGNPPWERVKHQEREWFAARCPAVAGAPDAAARGRLVRALADVQPALHAAYEEERRRADAGARFLLRSGRFPLSGRGDVNTYGPFLETALQILTSNDADEIRAALAELQAAGDALHGSVHAKLVQASQTS